MSLPSTPLFLDGALALAVLLMALSGMWRGVLREGFAGLGLLAGYAVASAWALRWSDDVADVVSISDTSAQFAIEAALILGGAALGALLGARALDISPPDMEGRLGGAALAAASWLLTIALVGSSAKQLVLGQDTIAAIDETAVLRRLVDRPDVVLLAFCVVGLIILLVATQVQRRRRDLFRPVAIARPSSPRLPRRDGHVLAPEAEKVEPPAGHVPGAMGALGGAGGYAETIPLPVVRDLSSPSEHAPRGIARSAQVSSDWIIVSTPHAPKRRPIRCPACDEAVTSRDRFCPRCGQQIH